MKENEYINYIIREIEWFECQYNKSPERIVMSSALALCIRNNIVVYNNEYYGFYDGIFGSVAGIPMQIYNSDKLECHLVEHTFELP